MFKKLLISLILVALINHVFAQNIGNSIEFNAEISLKYFPSSNHLSGKVYGAEVIYHKVPSSLFQRKLNIISEDWVLRFNTLRSLKINENINQFGDSYALLYGLNFSVLKTKYLNLNFSPAFGLGYTTKTIYTNENRIMGSHVNMYSRAALKTEISITSTTKLLTGINFLHISNAATRVPNMGFNQSSISFGISKELKNNQAKPSKESLTTFPDSTLNKHELELGLNIGRRGAYKSSKGLYRNGLYLGYNHRFNYFLALSLGLDAVYYHKVYHPDNNLGTYQSYASSLDRWRLGTAIGPSIRIGKFEVEPKYGYYLYFNSLKPMHTYWTVNSDYNLNKKLALQAKMYVHKAEADFLGLGFVYKLTP
ncbi:lipid A 3-O-deacylase (PagL) [Pedobacter glucosidilyticus]|nr:acyloxyacyl hydrolase [Pedobacter glucosidilyticus]KHJ37032.1 lipid A 3-O-deacylase (PagL) [Pedobacter glucosidilyticus]